MPFRRYFQDRGISHPVFYSMLTLAAAMFACMAIAVWVSISASNRALDQSESQQRGEDEKNRAATCNVVAKINDAYKIEPPVTAAGQNVAEAWADLSRSLRCEER